ncbi:MAG TPA: hypothetical protein DEG71_01720 [Clostridiales bacterium]|nr:hypothetical protein [Clostridiales bacterium]
MENDVQLFPCYSLPLRDYLMSNGLRYKLSALNENSRKKMWIFIDNDKLNSLLMEWKKTKPI